MPASRLLWAVAIAFPVLSGCQLSKSVSFTHEETERMRFGELADVPAYLRAGDGAFGITLIPYPTGYLVALPSYFSDIHTRVVVRSVMMHAPVLAEVALLDAPDWEPFESPRHSGTRGRFIAAPVRPVAIQGVATTTW